jgi:hypothetical protein
MQQSRRGFPSRKPPITRRAIMKKLSMLGILAGAALLTATPLSLQWSQKTVTLSLDSADARIGRPLTPLSVAGVHRRAYRRAYRGAVYGAAGAYGVGSYYGYGYPAYSYGYPAYSYGSYGYGYPAYGYGGYGGYLGYRVARRVAIHRARWR